ncbi:Integrase catalytic domain-containing protein [Citrus sinensis]|nr:Integrase catalytic domain-containing protein [Citrus sinensis]
MNRTLTERIRAMLRTVGLPNSLWEEAAKTTCYIINRSSSTAIGLKIVMEMWTGKPANYFYLHAFGCPVYVMYNAQERTKLDPKFKRCIFLGYVNGVKGYRLWDSTAHKIVIRRDVIFIQDQLQRRDEDDNRVKEKSETIPRYCARLVVKGYGQKEGIDFNKIFSPVVRLTTVRVVLTMCDTFDLYLEQLDVKTAFLHEELEEEIYMLQPEGFAETGKENLVCRLSSDHCAYYKRFEDNDLIILLLYVDDMLVAGPNKDRIQELQAQLAREFKMKNLGPANKILGMQIHRDKNNKKIWLSQKNYLKKILRHFNIQDFVKRILRCIRGTSYVALCYGGSEFTVRGYMDSDFARDLDKRKSTTSYLFTLVGTVVSWVSKLQTIMALSTTEAEYMAATQACKEAIWIQWLLEELEHKQEKIYVFCDCQNALHIARNPAFHSRTKHIGVQYHFVREVVEDRSVNLQKIHTKENLVDVLTKSINTDKFA